MANDNESNPGPVHTRSRRNQGEEPEVIANAQEGNDGPTHGRGGRGRVRSARGRRGRQAPSGAAVVGVLDQAGGANGEQGQGQVTRSRRRVDSADEMQSSFMVIKIKNA